MVAVCSGDDRRSSCSGNSWKQNITIYFIPVQSYYTNTNLLIGNPLFWGFLKELYLLLIKNIMFIFLKVCNKEYYFLFLFIAVVDFVQEYILCVCYKSV